MTKTEKIRRALLKYPKLKAKDLAKKIGVSVQDVYSTRYLAKKQNKANGYAPLETPKVKDGDEESKAINLLFNQEYKKYAERHPEIKEDMVNHPPHYTVGGIETIDFIEAKDLNYRLGNVIKYIVRSSKKYSDPLQDLQKARWYLNREIARVE
jgi:hypothetical protein